jgi:hypothetical protein
MNKQRLYSFLLTLGAGLLLFRVLSMVFYEDALTILRGYVVFLLFLEMILDMLCMGFSIRWFFSNSPFKAAPALNFGAAATILHSIRVLIYVLGRTDYLKNVDIRPEYHSTYIFDWFWVYFAAVLSILGIAVVIIIWRIRKKSKIAGR